MRLEEQAAIAAPTPRGRHPLRLAVARAGRQPARIATAATSLVVVLWAGSYLFSPTQTALAVAVAVDSAIHVPAGREIIYGTAKNAHGSAVHGITVSLDHGTGKRAIRMLSVTSRQDGTFRKVASLAAGSYAIVVSERSGHKTITATKTIKLKPRNAYRITVKIVRTGVLTLFPVRTY